MGKWNLFLGLCGLLAAAAAVAPASADGGDELRSIRQFGDITSGQLIGGGERADKVLVFGRSDGELVVPESRALTLGGEWIEPPAGAVAIMRTRASTAGGNAAPEPADIAYVERTGARVIIVGEWAEPPVIWEVARDSAGVRYREIDAEGSAGPWHTPSP